MSLRNTLPFATIPEWLLEADISDRAVRLYGLLVRHADQDGHAFPGRKRLSVRLKCSVDSVDRAVRELRDVGAVQVQPRLHEEGDRTSNDYLLRPGGRIPAATPLGTRAATVAAPVRPHEREPSEREPSERENPSFDDFWAGYPKPRRQGKGKAREEWAKAIRRAAPLVIIEGVRRLAADPNLPLDEPTLIPLPQTWLHQSRWEDDPLPPRRGKRWAEHPLDAMAREHLEEVNGADHDGGGRSRPAAVGELSGGPR